MAIVTAHVAAVQELYVAYFNRPADVAGLDYWTNVVEAQGGETAAVSASFAKQPEYIVAFYNLTNAQIVDKIYLNMFGRGTSTTDGRAYWVDLLNKGSVTVDVIVAEVAGGAQGTDSAAVENKVAAATAFTNALDTPAEQAGYAGEAALNAAKAFITGVTTDATLTNAIAPAALAATVAAVVKAGTPFSLASAVAASTAANEELADFLEENSLTSTGAEASLQGKVDTAATNIAGFSFDVDGDTTTTTDVISLTGFAGARPSVQAALLSSVETDLDEAVSDANEGVAAARAAASASVRAVADNLAAAEAAFEDADTAATEAGLVEASALASLQARFAGRTIAINTDTTTGDFTTVTIPQPAGSTSTTPITLIRVNDAGNIVLNSGVTEAAYPGVTALRDAIRANVDAQVELAAADEAVGDAEAEYDDLSADDQELADDIADAVAQVARAEKAVTDLEKLVTTWEEAVALQTEYKTLDAAADEAAAAFTSNGYVAPKFLSDATSFAATSGADLFLLGEEDATATISSFGRSGNDTIFLGNNFTLNTGDDVEEDGDNAVMEVFFIQNGSRTEVHVEQAVYGSESGDVSVITLIGVDVEDLQFANGVITMKAGTGA